MKVTENITITNEDNMQLMSRYEDNHFDLAIVDPPYGIERFKKGIGENDRFKVKATAIFNNNPPTDDYFNELFRVSKNQIIWGANNFVLPTTEYFCIWNKKQTVDNFATAINLGSFSVADNTLDLNYGPEVFNFTGLEARYFWMDTFSTDLWAGFPFVSIGEVAFAASPVPEPSTFLLLGGGLAGLAFVARRRRKE